MELVNQHSRLVTVPMCCLPSINIWWHCPEHIFLTCVVFTVWEADYWSQGSESLFNIVWLEAMCDKYSISLDIKAYYIVMNVLINKKKSDFLLPLQSLVLETFFPLCFSLLDTNLGTWYLRCHLDLPVMSPLVTGPSLVQCQLKLSLKMKENGKPCLFCLPSNTDIFSGWITTWRRW